MSRSVPTTTETGAAWVRFLDLTPENVVSFGYPDHPEGRYVSVEDLRRCLGMGATLASVLQVLDSAVAGPIRR